MARKNAGNGVNGKHDPQAPEGFDVSVGREKSDGWIAKEPGNVFQGRLLGRHEYKRRSGKLAAYYQILLQRGCKIQIVNEDELDEEGNATVQVIEGKEGMIVNVDEVKALEDLRGAVEKISRGAEIDVWSGFKSKEPNRSSEGTHWVLYPPRLRVVKQPTVPKEAAISNSF